ncbi:MAG: LysM peptidoglycan-binding domain-containing protein [Alphaproteobacteria bacterium]|nr:LysM peptidoglycan-binding domain-containing protein [Alphaproteobacteria bacterium]
MKKLFPLFALALAASPAPAAETIVVMPGDTLVKIAQQALGDGERWEEICARNRKLLARKCDLILPGMVLSLPKSAKAASADGAPDDNEASEVVAAPIPAGLVDLVQSATPIVPDGFSAASLPEGGYGLAGHVARPTAGKQTGAIAFLVPEAIETELGGHAIRVTLVGKASPKNGPFQVAYSTNDVGTSGWKKLRFDRETSSASFTYDVKPVKDGKGDYFGIQPDPANSGQALDIKAIVIEIVD